jgi:TonB family protein
MNAAPVGISTLVITCVLPVAVSALGIPADSRGLDGSAVDAKGVRHYPAEYPRHHIPWVDDQLQAFAPEYPRYERMQRHEGDGLFSVTLDPRTGTVTKVVVLKSTGFGALDSSAVASLRHFRWKPGKWRQIDIPITFQVRSGPPVLKPGQKLLPHVR